MKTIVISGYYGYDNIGDEALLASMVSSLKKALPGAVLIILSAKPQQTAALYGVEAVDRFNLPGIVNALRRGDLLVSGGGSLLQDVTGPLTIPYYLGIVLIAKLLGMPVMFYAQGIGPVKGLIGRTLVKWVGNNVDAISLRDQGSRELLREIGVSRPPVEVTADPVFGLELDTEQNSPNILTALDGYDKDKKLVGIFVREWHNLPGYQEALAQAADYLCAQGCQVVFVPMQFPRDVRPAQEIAKLMENRPLVLEQGLSLTGLAGLISSMDMVIGMRLHALIIAAVCAIPMVGISYDPKVSDFLTSIKQPCLNKGDEITGATVIKKVAAVMTDREQIKVQLQKTRQILRQKAMRNTEMVVELL